MRIAEGARGSGVRDVQLRLMALGYGIDDPERTGIFGSSTLEAVRAFQQQRGLVVDGVVGRETWRALVEASWKLGDRTLYVRAPHIRGDDVRELQERLNALGFDAGRVDGIFGQRTARALTDFQRNYGLPADGIAGDSTFRSLAGLPHLAGDLPVATVREREALRRMRPTVAGLVVVVDPGHGGEDAGFVGPSGTREDEVAFGICRRLEAALAASGAEVFLTRDGASGPPDHQRTALANTLGADLFLSVHAGGSSDEEACGAATYYFGHERFRSEAGARLAECIQDEITAIGLTNGRTHPKTWGVLRETQMPAVQVEPCFLTNPAEEVLLVDPAFQRRVAEAIAAALRRFAHQPVPA
jgi:N-acetylmuramoyl-L-alanine amidase